MRKEAIMHQAIEVLDYHYEWLLKFCTINQIAIPDRERVTNSLMKLRGLLDEFYDASPEDKATDEIDPTTRDATDNETTRKNNRTKIIAIYLLP
jgi:hypothetical protein